MAEFALAPSFHTGVRNSRTGRVWSHRVKEPGQVSECHLGYSKSPMTENGHEVGGTLLKPWRKIYVALVRLLSNVPFYTILNLDYLPPFLQWEEVFRVFSIVSGKTTWWEFFLFNYLPDNINILSHRSKTGDRFGKQPFQALLGFDLVSGLCT